MTMKLNEKVPTEELILFDKLVDAVNNKCYCERMNPDYSTIEKACSCGCIEELDCAFREQQHTLENIIYKISLK